MTHIHNPYADRKFPVRHIGPKECWRCGSWTPVFIECEKCLTCRPHCTCPELRLGDVAFAAVAFPVLAVIGAPILLGCWICDRIRKD